MAQLRADLRLHLGNDLEILWHLYLESHETAMVPQDETEASELARLGTLFLVQPIHDGAINAHILLNNINFGDTAEEAGRL